MIKYGVIGEDKSDVETLKVIVRRLTKQQNMPVLTRGCSGKGDLFRNGKKLLKLFQLQGANRFIVCCDSDDSDDSLCHERILNELIKPAQIVNACSVVAVEEIEAWILADLAAVNKIFTSLSLSKFKGNPEKKTSPKEYIASLCRAKNSKPLYINAVHNEKIAVHLDLEAVYNECFSFRKLYDFVRPT